MVTVSSNTNHTTTYRLNLSPVSAYLPLTLLTNVFCMLYVLIFTLLHFITACTDRSSNGAGEFKNTFNSF